MPNIKLTLINCRRLFIKWQSGENFAKSGHIATYIDQCDRMDSFFTTIQTIIIHFQSFKILPNLVTLPSCSRLKQVLIKSFDKLDPNDDDQCDQFCQILWFILVDFELILAIFCMPFGTFWLLLNSDYRANLLAIWSHWLRQGISGDNWMGPRHFGLMTFWRRHNDRLEYN